MHVGGVIAGDFRQYPGVVDAIQKAHLSFRVQGKLNEILVREGDMVKKDQLLARLDPTNYQIILNDRKASYTTATANFDPTATGSERGDFNDNQGQTTINSRIQQRQSLWLPFLFGLYYLM
jgi:multidrug efflux pump subunit AcrA (membrane-fusion protein)